MYLLLDCPNLCYISHYGMPSLSLNGKPTSVLVGFFRDLIKLRKMFTPDKTGFCFDEGVSLREKILPNYKAGRRSLEPYLAPGREIKHLKRQMELLRKEYLPRLGFSNIFSYEGYEADDLIASLVMSHPGNYFIIVSSDKDFYQILGERVKIFNPRTKKVFTHLDLMKELEVTPKEYLTIKAIAGCRSDSIRGITGVGEKFAGKYVRGILKPTTVAYKRIIRSKDIWQKNLEVIKLPLEGTPEIKLQEDKVNLQEWQKILDELEIRNLRL